MDGISIMGIHQDISETVRLEKEKEAERRLAELNDTLRKEKIEQEDYYKELLEMHHSYECTGFADVWSGEH